jgi:hypothetical protein
MGNLNKAPNDFFDNWNAIKEKKIREIIDIRKNFF